MLDKLVSELESRFLHYQVDSLLAKDFCIKINFMPRFINCLQGVNESRIRLAVYRAVDSALDEYSKTVEDVSTVCTVHCAMCSVQCAVCDVQRRLRRMLVECA